MQHAKMFPNMVHAARGGPDRWYVKNGDQAVGPVALDLLARGVAAGKVPLDAWVRHECWQVWCPLSDLADLAPSSRPQPDSWAPRAQSSEPTIRFRRYPSATTTDDILETARPSLPADFMPMDAIDGAANRTDGLLLLLNAAVTQAGADAALVHEIEGEHAVVVGGHGVAARGLLSAHTPLFDAAMAAAAAGSIVVAEPTPGVAGLAILQRLGRIAGPMDGAVALPVHTHGRLVAVLELGRRTAFRPAELAALEALVQALATKFEALETQR